MSAMDEVRVQNPRTGNYEVMSRDEAVSFLQANSPYLRWHYVCLRVLLWAAGLGYLASAAWLCGPVVLWGVLGGLLLAWAWSTR